MAIFFRGPDISGPEYGFNLNFTIINDVYNSSLKKDQIINNFNKKLSCAASFAELSEYENVVINAHGGGFTHYSFPFTFEWKHSLYLCKEAYSTAKIFSLLAKPVNLKLMSCYSGLAQKDAKYLSVGSTLYTDSKDTSPSVMRQSQITIYPDDNPFINFYKILSKNPYTLKFSIVTEQGVFIYNTGEFFLKNKTKESILDYIHLRIEKFTEFLNSYKEAFTSKQIEYLDEVSQNNFYKYPLQEVANKNDNNDYIERFFQNQHIKDLLYKETSDACFINLKNLDPRDGKIQAGNFKITLEQFEELSVNICYQYKNNYITPIVGIFSNHYDGDFSSTEEL